MDSNLRAAKKYFRRVKRLLFCDAKSREQIHNRAFKFVEDFAEENPSADYAEFVKAFGEPEAFAADILSVLNKHEVENAKKRYKRNRIIFGALIVAIFIFIVVIMTVKLRSANITVEDYKVYYVVEDVIKEKQE